MNPHRQNFRPRKPVGFGWALCILAGAALAVGALLLRLADVF